MAGVTIGDNTVIGAGSLVKKDIPANVVAVGVPCKVLRETPRRIRTDTRGKALQPAYRLKTPWGQTGPGCKCAAFCTGPVF